MIYLLFIEYDLLESWRVKILDFNLYGQKFQTYNIFRLN